MVLVTTTNTTSTQRIKAGVYVVRANGITVGTVSKTSTGLWRIHNAGVGGDLFESTMDAAVIECARRATTNKEN